MFCTAGETKTTRVRGTMILVRDDEGRTTSLTRDEEDGAGDRDRTGDIQLGKLAFYR
jgi:hypothetical protein